MGFLCNFYRCYGKSVECSWKLYENIEYCPEWHDIGVPKYEVDGNNAVDVWQAAYQAVQRGRNDEGPSFIEAHTYRQRGHVEFEYTFLSRAYRDQNEVELWKTNDKDPILRLESYFIEHSKYSGDDIEKIQKEFEVRKNQDT